MPEPPTSDPAPPLVRPASTSLFLDFDGTLVDLADRPDGVSVGDGLAALLERVAVRLDGRLAIVSGRSIAQLAKLLGPSAERLALVGSHGAEVRPSGGVLIAPRRSPSLLEAEAIFAAEFAGDDRIVVEVKTLGVAVHYRLASTLGPRAHELAQALGARHGLLVQEGKMMVELRMGGHDKGSGIAALMAGAPFGGCDPVFLGDDVTDEPGFAQCMRMGGFGVLVGTPRLTAARYRLPDVAAVHRWLSSL